MKIKNNKTYIKHNSKKGDMSINLIIVIVIGLVILAILLYIVYNKSQQVSGAGKCEARGGLCLKEASGEFTEKSLTICKTDSKEYDGYCYYKDV